MIATMTDKEKATKVLNYLDEQTSSVVIGLLNPYLKDHQLADLYDNLVTDGAIEDTEKPEYEQLSFEALCKELEYFDVRASQKKTAGEICEEVRDYIRNSGHACLDDDYDCDEKAIEWMKENHPELYKEGEELSCSSVLYQPLEFCCAEEYSDDLCFVEVNISFYGDWDSGKGVFCVSKE